MNKLKRTLIATAVGIAVTTNAKIVLASGCTVDANSDSYIYFSGLCDLSSIADQTSGGGEVAHGGVNTVTSSFGTLSVTTGIDFDSTGEGYLSIMDGGAKKYLINSALNSSQKNILNSEGNLFLRKASVTSSTVVELGQYSESFSVNGDLLIDHRSDNGNSANVNITTKNLHVAGDLKSIFYAPNIASDNEYTRNVNIWIGNGENVVDGGVYIYNMNNGRGLAIGNGSLNVEKDIFIVMDRGSDNVYQDYAAGLYIDGYRATNPRMPATLTADKIEIHTKDTKGMVLRAALASANTLRIDTTHGTAYQNAPGIDVKAAFGAAFADARIISYGNAVNFSDRASGGAFNLYLGVDGVNLDEIVSEVEKAGQYFALHLGGKSYLESKNSDAIYFDMPVWNRISKFILNVDENAEIVAAAGYKLLNSRNQSNTININAGAILFGDMELDAGNDIFNYRGAKFQGTILMKGGDDTVNLLAGNSNDFISMDAGVGSNDVLNIHNATNGYTNGSFNGINSASSPGIKTPSFVNFNTINVKSGGVLNLTGSDIAADNFYIEAGGQISLDPSIKSGAILPSISIATIHGNVINSGFLNLDVNGSNIGQTLAIDGNYIGNNGFLEIDTKWVTANHVGASSITDELIITGNASGRTRVSVRNGIAGDVTLSDNPVIPVPEITVLGDISPNAFWGYENTMNAGEAQLVLNAQTKKYYWTLQNSDGGEIYSPDIPGYVLVPYVNMELMRDSVSTYRDRIGGEYNKAYDYGRSKDRRTWWRIWHKHMHGNGAQRLDWKSNNSGYQIGYQLENRTEKGRSVRTDGYVSYIRSASNAFDQMSSDSAEILSNKFSGNMHTHNINIGLTHTYVNSDNSYKDMVLQLSTLKNNYQGRRGGHAANRTWGLTASFEQGKQFNIADRWYVEPMYQVMANYLALENFNDGVRNVSQGKHWDGLLRTGGRLYFRDPVNEAQNNLVYMKAHYVRDLSDNGKATIGRSTVTEKNAKQWMEFGVGFQVNGSKNTHFFFDASMDRNLGGAYRDSYQVQFGITHKW